MRAVARYRVKGSWEGGREALLAGEETSRAPQPFLGVSVNSLSTVICSFLELVCMNNLFSGLRINLKKVVLVLWSG